MDKREEYQNLAAQALSVAEESKNPEEKLVMLDIAQRWLDLAMNVWTPTKIRERAQWRGRPLSERN